MTDKTVTESDSETDDRGIPIKNLQAELNRKLVEMEARTAERLEAITKQLESFSTEPEPDKVETATTYDQREELRKISANPRGYVEELIQPLKQENELLKKEVEQAKILTVRGLWEKQEEAIARMEGKKDWRELPSEVQKGVIDIVKEKGWGGNPNSATDAYELFKMREAKKNADDPDRAARIASSTTEGSGRVSGKTPVKTLARSSVEALASTHPKHPDYRKNMETLGRVQSGEIKVE